MITVTRVTEMGGACPWQLEGLTAEGREIYARYRGGRVAVYLDTQFPIPKDCIFSQRFGEPLDGCLNGATLASLTAGVITWPREVVEDGEVIQP